MNSILSFHLSIFSRAPNAIIFHAFLFAYFYLLIFFLCLGLLFMIFMFDFINIDAGCLLISFLEHNLYEFYYKKTQ